MDRYKEIAVVDLHCQLDAFITFSLEITDFKWLMFDIHSVHSYSCVLLGICRFTVTCLPSTSHPCSPWYYCLHALDFIIEIYIVLLNFFISILVTCCLQELHI
jgi:hypothetical protein